MYLVLAEEGQMEQNFEGLSISSHDDELGDTAVEGLSGLVRAALQLLVVGRLLDKIEQLDGQLVVSEGVRLGVHLVSHCCDVCVDVCAEAIWKWAIAEMASDQVRQ